MPGTRTIGGVLAALASDFPDLTISKIRFLEAEGLVTPHRTGAGIPYLHQP
jgi:DNA-binding transcriptional MerR regulator